MATAFESDVRIRRPATEVWDALTDWPTAPEWMRGVDGISADGPVTAGTALRFSARGAERPAEIVEAESGRLLVLRYQQGSVTAIYRYEVEELGEQLTRFGLIADCTVSGPLRLVAPLLRVVLRRSDGGQPEAMRARLEA